MNELLVSIVIPVYNRERELKRALTSVLRQTEQNFEVWVVDDCSEVDLFSSVIQPLNDHRIHYRKLPTKGNANVCRNLGIQESQGKYIALLDSDDEWLPEHLEKRINLIEEMEVDGLFGSMYLDDTISRRPSFSRRRRQGESMADYLLTNGSAQTSSYFLKADSAKKVLWDERLKRHQDYDYAIRFTKDFRFEPCSELTVIVHWAKGERRSESFESHVQFIKKHKSSISPRVYNQYHYKGFFAVVDRDDISSEIKHHYKKESKAFPSHLTLTEFLAVEGYDRTAIPRFLLRFRFLFLVLLKIK